MLHTVFDLHILLSGILKKNILAISLLDPGFPCKCMFLYKLVILLKLCKYSFDDLTIPNSYTFFRACLHILAFWGVISCIMHILKIFRFNSIYFDFYIAYCHFSSFSACITLTCIIVHFIQYLSYE